MALSYQRNEIEFKCTSEHVNVPNNDVARLMYYLNAVCYTIECDDHSDIQRFRDFHNWRSLSVEEQKALLLVCYAFSPDVLDNRVFFYSPALCGEYNNNFYTIDQVKSQLLATDSIVIAGRVREVNRIMAYQMPWMKMNYFEPMERLARVLANASQESAYRPRYTPHIIQQPIRNSSSSSCCTRRCCFISSCVIYCIVVVLPLLIGLIIGIVNGNKKTSP